jgi:hypothetical protein
MNDRKTAPAPEQHRRPGVPLSEFTAAAARLRTTAEAARMERGMLGAPRHVTRRQVRRRRIRGG